MVLVRHLLGGVLRRQRMRQGRTLRQVSADARVSLGYISEVERGQKEASSELLAAICTALDVPLSTVLQEVSEELAQVEQNVPAQTASPASTEREMVPAVPARDLTPSNALGRELTGASELASGELEPATALTKRLETRLIDSQRLDSSCLAAPDNRPDVVAAA
jgi:transcriptional regulator with XRE-family HTH domain